MKPKGFLLIKVSNELVYINIYYTIKNKYNFHYSTLTLLEKTLKKYKMMLWYKRIINIK